MIKATYRKTPDIYPLRHIRVVDGDTLEAEILLPFDTVITKRVRLKGWWADECDGLYRTQGLMARYLLEVWCTDKALWLHSPSCRLDRYGRVIGHLMHGEQIINPKDVLGSYALTEKEHKLRRDQQMASSRQAKKWPHDGEAGLKVLAKHSPTGGEIGPL
jgi:hypothetical protein